MHLAAVRASRRIATPLNASLWGMSTQRTLRIGVLQFTPTYANPQTSARRVEELTARWPPGSIDLLVAPEMCLTGYVFDGLGEIKGLCEDVRDEGSKRPTIDFARSLSKRLGCHTLLGFPEVEHGGCGGGRESKTRASAAFDARPEAAVSNESGPPSHPRYYNSAILTSPDGSITNTFRKHFLFDDDERWCGRQGGAGFQFIDLPLGKNGASTRIAVGICMDLNPFRFQTPWERFEFASFCRDNSVDVVVLSMAWLSNKAETEVEAQKEEKQAQAESMEPNFDTINYWAMRCEPLWKQDSEDTSNKKRTILVAANRTGTERSEFTALPPAPLCQSLADTHTLLAFRTLCSRYIRRLFVNYVIRTR